MRQVKHRYEVRPRKAHRGVDLVSDALPCGRLWYGEVNAVSNAVGYAMHRSRSHQPVIRIYDEARNVLETPEHTGDFKRTLRFCIRVTPHFRAETNCHDSAFVQ